MRRSIAFALLIVLASAARAQDVLSIGSETVAGGVSAQLPVTIANNSGTALDAIHGVAFKVLFPPEAISSISFTRGASLTPLFETTLSGDGWISYIGTFASPVSGQIGTLNVTATSDAVLRLDPPSAMLSNLGGTITETVANGALALVNGNVFIGTVPAPANLVATATGGTQVSVSWSAVPGADFYQLFRNSFHITSSAGTSVVDTTVSAGTSYVYRVRAVDGSAVSPFSNADAATTIFFTDDPIVPQTTVVKALHVVQLRTAVNAMRATAGLAPVTVNVAPGDVVALAHVAILRNALNEARAELGLPVLTFTGGNVIQAAHVQELRSGVK